MTISIRNLFALPRVEIYVCVFQCTIKVPTTKNFTNKLCPSVKWTFSVPSGRYHGHWHCFSNPGSQKLQKPIWYTKEHVLKLRANLINKTFNWHIIFFVFTAFTTYAQPLKNAFEYSWTASTLDSSNDLLSLNLMTSSLLHFPSLFSVILNTTSAYNHQHSTKR